MVAAETEKLTCRAPPYAFFTQRVADQQWLGCMYVLKKLGLGWEGTLSLRQENGGIKDESQLHRSLLPSDLKEKGKRAGPRERRELPRKRP